MPLHRRQLRRWTALVLSAWIFGIAAQAARDRTRVQLPRPAIGPQRRRQEHKSQLFG
jgi:hypothetical protein